MKAVLTEVLNRGSLKPSFIAEMITWARSAPVVLFAVNAHYDIFDKVKPELGPYEDITHRTAVLLEVMRVLILFESGGNWREGNDASKSGPTTSENEEAGPGQQSWDSRKLDKSLADWLAANDIHDGKTFRRVMTTDHKAALTYIAMVLRVDIADYNRIANGPIRRGVEREHTWPTRPNLWKNNQSIYPWLSRDAVNEFKVLLQS